MAFYRRLNMTNQPKWRCIANLGDTNPLEYGGAFLLVDETGVYPPEMEVWQDADDTYPLRMGRFILERCTYRDGVLSDNKYHPEMAAWWAKDLSAIADQAGREELELIQDLCSVNPFQRAQGYLDVMSYHGLYEMCGGCVDAWPKRKRGEVALRMRHYLGQIGDGK
jgi:hypothetical protein